MWVILDFISEGIGLVAKLVIGVFFWGMILCLIDVVRMAIENKKKGSD